MLSNIADTVSKHKTTWAGIMMNFFLRVISVQISLNFVLREFITAKFPIALISFLRQYVDIFWHGN